MNILHKERILEIDTENYYLTLMEKKHAAQMFEFLGDHETMKYLTPNPPKSVLEVAEKVAGYQNHFQAEKEIPWVIIDKKSDEVIGMFRLHKLNFWHRKTEMAVVIRRDFQKKGVMTEVLTRVLSFCFHDLDLNRVVGDIFSENTGSRKLLLKHGFKEEGRLRQTDFDGKRYHDTVVFSLLKSEYENNHF